MSFFNGDSSFFTSRTSLRKKRRTVFENEIRYNAKPSAVNTSIVMLNSPPPALMPMTNSEKQTAALKTASRRAGRTRHVLSRRSALNAS